MKETQERVTGTPCGKGRRWLWLGISLAVLLALFVVCAVYLSNGYEADTEAINAFATDVSVTREERTDGLVFSPQEPQKGFIFYPGGKVEHIAYEPLMRALAAEGFLCVLLEMPFDLAVLAVNAADGVREQYPAVTEWYIGGHSLGGSMAASYLQKNAQSYAGLVLLGSYSTADLSQSGLSVLSVYGSEDLVLNREKYEQCRQNLPQDTREVVIEGGCHAYFGMYGAQAGDGTPTVTNEEQIARTVQEIVAFAAK